MNDDPQKIVSLAQRRREDEARRKAEVAAQARAQNQARSQARQAPASPERVGSLIGRIVAVLVWLSLFGALALLAWSWLA